MKQIIKVGLIIMMIGLFACISCKKDDETVNIPPSIQIIEEAGYISSDTAIAAGGEINLKLMLQKGDLNITNFIIDVYTADGVQNYFDTGMNVAANYEWHGKFVKSLAQQEEWKFIVRDRDGNAGTTSLVITLDTTGSYQTLSSYSPVIFGAQDNTQIGGCYALGAYSMYFHNEAAADTSIQRDIDMVCFYDSEDKNAIASPGASFPDGIFPVNPADWTIVNTTRYFETDLTTDDFNAAVNDSIVIANYDEGEAKRKAKKLNGGEIYTFRTQQGKLGMFLVNEVIGTNEGSINISLKVQP